MIEPSDEEKAVIIMTEQCLEIALDNCTFRWLFCWNGQEADSCYDCACCLSWDKRIKTCQCKCHGRIRESKKLFRTAIYSKLEHNKSWFWDRSITGNKCEKHP